MRQAGGFVLIAALLAPGAAAQGILEAGVAQVELTPQASMAMYGYANRKCGPSNGTHDSLMAKVLVLRTGESRVAIVTADLGSLVSPALRGDIATRLGIPLVLLAASHTHSAPRFLPSGDEAGEPGPYQREIEAKMFAAVEQASRSLFPARLSTGRGSLQLGYNRLLPREDGRSRALFDNLERIPYGPVDPEFMLLRVDDAEGKPRALIVHYACHAVVLGPTNCKISADFPGVLQAKVEEAMQGTQCMFVQGGAGDINPLFMARTGREEEDFATVRKMGETFSNAVLQAARRMGPGTEIREPIQTSSEVLKFSDRWDSGKFLEVGIATVLIGREIAIAAVPGEPMHRLQTTWKERAEVEFPLFYGYTWTGGGPWPGYIPDLRSAAHGGYGADASTRIEVGAGERIMERLLIALYRLQGKWREKPGRP